MSKPLKKIEVEKLPQDYSPSTLPEILKLVKKIKGDSAFVYEHLNKPFFMETDRLIIRHFTPDDAEAVLALSLDRMGSSMKNFDHQWPTDMEGCMGAAAYFASKDIYYAVCLKPSMKLIGFIAYNNVNEDGIMDLGHVWHTAHQDNDLDTEALSLMTQYAFEKLGANGLTSGNPLECEEQIAPLKTIGMSIVETINNVSFVKDENGKPIEFTGCKMLITKEQWDTSHPESYFPKDKPEILSMMGEHADRSFPESYMLERIMQNGEEYPGSRCPEMQPFTTSIRAFLDYTGQNYGYIGYDFGRLDVGFMLVCNLSGEAYVDDLHMCDGNATAADYESYKNMFRYLGYENYELVYTKDSSEKEMKARIMKCLVNEKTPVIVDNLAECPIGCAVVGYEKNGDILIGWNYHVFDFSPNPQPQLFRKENWYEEAAYVAFIGKRTNTPELKELYRQGILSAYNTLTDGLSMKNARYFNDWKRYFTQTEEECIEEAKRTHYIIGYGTPPESIFADDETIRQELVRTIDPAWSAYSERRYYAKFFMRQAQKYFPGQAQTLEEIACCFERISHVHMEAFIRKAGHDPVDRDKLRDPVIRLEMAEMIDQCRAEEEKAILLLNQIIKAMKAEKLFK
ncbi:RimJ/RimL family protein N-acetyltransferase [Anaerotaenia torta]|uniref:GNAT family N-acetyltransferase n=1 Tax=Anaerotaenia torta TaxID=433293 RepID=UPI003D253938